MTSLARRTQVRNDRRYTTARGSRQGRDLERNSVWILKGTGVVGSLEMPLPSCFHQNPMANGGLAPRSREVISSAFQGPLGPKPSASMISPPEMAGVSVTVSYTHLRAHETRHD